MTSFDTNNLNTMCNTISRKIHLIYLDKEFEFRDFDVTSLYNYKFGILSVQGH